MDVKSAGILVRLSISFLGSLVYFFFKEQDIFIALIFGGLVLLALDIIKVEIHDKV